MAPAPPATAATVIKVGGHLLASQGALGKVVRALANAAERGNSLLVVPGGGPFADTVRRIDQEIGLSPDAAHWMAILGMDQYAALLASRIPRARLVTEARAIAPARDAGFLPVLAPYLWLRNTDPLPHSWEVTSDSIAAWLAGQVGASRLVLVKPVIAERATLVDSYFEQALPSHVRVLITAGSATEPAMPRGGAGGAEAVGADVIARDVALGELEADAGGAHGGG